MLLIYKLFFFVTYFGLKWTILSAHNFLVLTFRPEGNTSPRAKMLTTFTNVREFTICFWYRPIGNPETNTIVLDYEIQSGQKDELLIYLHANLKVCIQSNNPTKSPAKCFAHVTPLLKWQHTCFVWSSYTGTVHFYKNGQLTEIATNFKPNLTFINGGELYVGANQSNFRSAIFPQVNNLFGELTEMHVWNRRLCTLQIQKVAKCNSTLKGDLLSWGKTKMILIDNVEIGTDPDVCAACE